MIVAAVRAKLIFLVLASAIFSGANGLAQDGPPDDTAASEAAAEPTAPALLDSRVTATQDRARLVLDLTTPTEFAVYTANDPMRVVVELRGQAGDDQDNQPAGDGLVTAYGIDAPGEDRVRVTLSLAGPAQVQQSYILDAFEDQPARLVIDLVPDTAENFAADARGAEPTVEQAEQAAEPAELDGAQTAPGETATAADSVRPLVIIDPGHGGVDGGARATNGLEEKNIVLAFALKLQNLLVETGRFDVALTRDTDTFLTLSERVALARLNQADLFISLHADSFDQEDVRGASIYTRGDLATSDLDRVLAENENRVDLIAGLSPPEDEGAIDVLVDFLARETRRQSYLAGQALIEQLEPSVQLRRFPLRQADFFVLNSPDIPSVLIELGFLSNSDDTQNLTTDAWLDRVAAALARGVAVYFDGRF
ncbi:N-acetylmuramoyl-L-alanine amidase [Pelagibacterium halotolerans]|uniref:N-acetylmuramoyl-L-alanine amidase n=1 Tax=Pelagibacterium halotolerans (strain DSM 22347 / JCM 15775 / CGMCC 1.7692 / B2) TaxID=1082931 RepID=G4RAL5_PELHB|nr:N-acetylmuramoyl-L-alanine amidase [Pelagibacterium halotolerans]AEQ51564.1 N-acetylmuramoyl-L-alanine amidase [Pelagibacterium halotolerans B2]QJR18605.1 N-acetylmuramoyl-L-alanine amidase [Pelagibacterium halotolerans]SEA17040.1 N-acetylmuramoyl-L-alanine amidase [Pelagibacterium halotolerans]